MTVDVSNSPVIVYVAVVVGVAIVIASAVPRILGPLGTAFSEWAKRRRRVAIETDDVRVLDLQADVAYLKAELASLRTEMRARDELIRQHEDWDRKLLRAYLNSDPKATFGLPPKLYHP